MKHKLPKYSQFESSENKLEPFSSTIKHVFNVAAPKFIEVVRSLTPKAANKLTYKGVKTEGNSLYFIFTIGELGMTIKVYCGVVVDGLKEFRINASTYLLDRIFNNLKTEALNTNKKIDYSKYEAIIEDNDK